jgi:CRP-like cAMP-binding protein
MACFATPTNLQTALEQHCERISKPRSTVLFRCGEKAFGLFVVFSGNVSLGFGVESALTRSYGPGALVGLPATLTGRSYCMTATVTEDAELGFCSLETLDSLLCKRPDLCRQLLTVLGERMAENSEMQKALLNRDD